MTLIYKNMILPILEYGDIFLTSLSKGTQKTMQVLQNKALKIALNYRQIERTNTIHQEARLAKLEVRRKIHTLHFVFRKKEQTQLLVKSPIGRITRSSKKTKFKLRKPVTEKYKACLSYKAVSLRGPESSYTPPGFLGVPNASSQSILSFGIALQAQQSINKGLLSASHRNSLRGPESSYTPPNFWGCQTHLAKAY